MHTSLLSAFQSEPWSLMFLGAALFALSSVARRRAVDASPASDASAEASTGHGRLVRRSAATVYTASAHGLRGRLRSRLAKAA